RLHDRYRLLGKLESSDNHLLQTTSGGSMRGIQERALDIVTGKQALRAFNLDEEPTTLRDRYGRFALGQNLLLGRRLIEASVRLVCVYAWCGDIPGQRAKEVNTWDMHGVGTGNIFSNEPTMSLGWALPRVDQGMSTLLEDMHQRGLLENTLVVAAGEFGRSPK